MKKVLAFYTLISVLALMSGCSGRGEEMREHLLSLEAANRADSVMRNDSLAEAVAAYFDRHGTPNERMRAYYMLGRTYADLGESPKALEAYIHAEGSADTLANDCNYDLLCRVHAQKAALFDRQYLPNETLKELNEAIRCAYRCQDTLTALVCYENRIRAFMQLARHDDMFVTADSAFNQYQRLGKNVMAANAVSGSIYYLIQQDRLAKAKGYIDFCRNAVDTLGNAYNRRGLLYSDLGYYYLKRKQSDSAVVYFRKQMQFTSWLENRVLGCKGLFKAYQQLGLKDSAMKYAELYNIANDSSNIFESADRLQRMQSLYNYERSRNLAEQKTREAERKKQMLWWMGFLFASILVFMFLIVLLYLRKRKFEEQKRLVCLNQEYNSVLILYTETKKNLCLLQQQGIQNQTLLEEKKKEISHLQYLLSQYQADNKLPEDWNLDEEIFNVPLIKKIHSLASKGLQMSDDCLADLHHLTDNLFPQFFSHLESLSPQLTQKRRCICMLTKLRFVPSEIASLMGISLQSVSNSRSLLSKTLFQCRTSDFDYKIREL